MRKERMFAATPALLPRCRRRCRCKESDARTSTVTCKPYTTSTLSEGTECCQRLAHRAWLSNHSESAVASDSIRRSLFTGRSQYSPFRGEKYFAALETGGAVSAALHS